MRPVDLQMLDALITAGLATSRAEAIGWVLARIRERPPRRHATAFARPSQGLPTAGSMGYGRVTPHWLATGKPWDDLG